MKCNQITHATTMHVLLHVDQGRRQCYRAWTTVIKSACVTLEK